MKLSDAEWLIMNALWARHPASAREVNRQLPAEVGWAYTTIKTMLARLVEKKVVRASKDGNISIYEPILSRRKARQHALQGLANRAFDGAFGPLIHFLVEERKLSDKQRAELIQALKKSRKRKESNK